MKKLFMLLLFLGFISNVVAQNRGQNRRAQANSTEMNRGQFNNRQLAEKTLQFIKIELPDTYGKLMEMRKSNQRKFRRMVTALARRYNVLEKLRNAESDSYEPAVKRFKVEIRIQELKEKFKESDEESEQNKLRSEIENLLEQSFEAKMQITSTEIKRLEAKLIENKEKLKKRMKNKDKAIQLRLEQLLNEDIKW